MKVFELRQREIFLKGRGDDLWVQPLSGEFERCECDGEVRSYKDCQDFPSPWACRCENEPLSLEDLDPWDVESVTL